MANRIFLSDSWNIKNFRDFLPHFYSESLPGRLPVFWDNALKKTLDCKLPEVIYLFQQVY